MTVPAVAQAGTAGTWHDLAPDLAADVLGRLQLTGTDPDTDRVTQHAREACAKVDGYLGLLAAPGRILYVLGGRSTWTYAPGDVPADVAEAARILTLEAYRRGTMAFGITGTWSPTGEPVRASADHFRGVAALLAPYVESWGFA